MPKRETAAFAGTTKTVETFMPSLDHDIPRSTADVIVVGGGLAGLFCALRQAPRPVTVISAAPFGQDASTAWAQRGIAAAVTEGDSAEAHAADTIALMTERSRCGRSRRRSSSGLQCDQRNR
jgi:L-aspartate oxidase